MNYSTILALAPILALLDGYAMQQEMIKSLEWKDAEISLVVFPCGEFRRVIGGWVLSINSQPLAIFPA